MYLHSYNIVDPFLYPMHKIIIGPTWIQLEIFRRTNDVVSIQLLNNKHKACFVNKSYLTSNQVPPT